MTDGLIQIYPPEPALHTDERERLYADILENFDIGEFKKKTFAPALKRLCLQGQIESRDERIGGLRDPNQRINPLGTYVHAYLCIASPVVSEEAFVAILQHYKPQSLTDMAIELVRHFDGIRMQRPESDLFQRIRCLVRALEQVIPAESFQYLCGSMFSRFLSRACYDKHLEHCMAPDCWDGVDRYVSMGRNMESIRNLAAELFSGMVEMPGIYQDRHVLQFLQAYFQRQFGPHLLALLDSVYQAIPVEQRLRMEQGVPVVQHRPRRDEGEEEEKEEREGEESDGEDATPASATTISSPAGTGFFCLARSATAAHSNAVQAALQARLPEDATAPLLALAPFAPAETLARVDDTTLLLGWEAELAPEAGRDETAACTAAGCEVLAPALWLESGEVLHLRGLQPGQAWRFSRAHGGNGAQDGDAEIFDVPQLLALLLARVAETTSPSRRSGSQTMDL